MQRLIVSIVLICIASMSATPLDDYVNTPDPHYKYELLKTYDQVGYKIYILNMTSQKWLDETVTHNPIWWHFLCITIPDKIVRPDAAFMIISNGNNIPDDIPQPTDEALETTGLFSLSTGAVSAVLKQVPNQPTVFLKDPDQKQRREDAVIAFTWKLFLDNPQDPSILLRLPMTKAAVKGMDTIVDFVEKQGAGTIKKFMIEGESKRGWTTWTTAAVDKRVFAAVPMTMDLCNLNTNLHSHFKSLGNWTFAFFYYYELEIMKKIDSPAIFEMEKVIDPKTYFDRYRDIKLMVVNTGDDELFLPDDTYYWWNDLVKATGGSVLLRRIPNAHHTFPDINMFFNYRSFFLTAYEEKPLPIVTWTRSNNGTHGIINATVDILNGLVPRDAKVYFAKTADNKRRDFRWYIANPNDPSTPIFRPIVWEASWSILTVKQTPEAYIYTAAIANPNDGWLAYFIEFDFDSIEDSSMKVTTEANIIPDFYPYPDCTLDSCEGSLV